MKNSIKINATASSCQVQQGSNNSIQTIKIGNEFNYDKVLDVLLSIQKSSNSDEFVIDFRGNTEKIKSVISDTIKMVERKDTPTNIKKSLEKIKSFAQDVTGSILATGICHSLSKLLN